MKDTEYHLKAIVPTFYFFYQTIEFLPQIHYVHYLFWLWEGKGC